MKHNKVTYNAANKITTFHFKDGCTMELWNNTTRCWYLNGKKHREDGPAVMSVDGSKYWYLNGELHREDEPAVIYVNGSKIWYLNGELHREDGPAVMWVDGSKQWYLNGKRQQQ